MIDKIKELLVKYRELIVYGIFGVLTTLVDFGIYWIFQRKLGFGETAAKTISVVAAILFAFVVNKLFVFEDKRNGFRDILTQLVSFASMRLISGAFQIGCVELFVERLGFYDMAVNVAAAVVVVILNYIFSKLLIFQKK